MPRLKHKMQHWSKSAVFNGQNTIPAGEAPTRTIMRAALHLAAVRQPMTGIHITDIEAAINHWRQLRPSPDGVRLTPEVKALAAVYARLIHTGAQEIQPDDLPPFAMQAWLAWYATQPDTPCIAICSTSQGDAQCKGCGRSFAEVQQWLEFTPVQKRAVWRRIQTEGQALRFTRYAERGK
jgi:predicted Fe-S protein YdhL (DUF1289 family)